MAFFGASVGISGGYAIVGSPLETVSGVTQAGVAYMFQRTAANDLHSIPTAVVTLKEPGLEDWYGWAAAIRGDCALESAFNRDERGTNAGTVSPSESSSPTTRGCSPLGWQNRRAHEGQGYWYAPTDQLPVAGPPAARLVVGE